MDKNEYSYQERHMGTDVSLSFICADVAMADIIATETFATINEYEQRFSRFLPNSELSKINQQGSGAMSNEFSAVIQRTLELVTLTKGAFNPLVQVKALGYQTTYTTLKETLPITSSLQYDTDYTKISIDKKYKHITLSKNQQLDFGGILKGYLANMLADHIAQKYPECTGSIINIGGDIATRGADELHEPFIFMLYNPVIGTEMPVTVQDSSLATSGTYARRWQTNNGEQHHIVDTKTNTNPDNDIIAVSIIHTNGAFTEVLTKLFLTRGIQEAIRTVSPEQYNYQYFVVSTNGKVQTNITSL